MRAPRYLLVHHGHLRIIDDPSDGVYSVVEFDSRGEAYRYLRDQFGNRPRVLAMLEVLVEDEDEDDEDDEDEKDGDEEDEEEDDEQSGFTGGRSQSSAQLQATQRRSDQLAVLKTVARLIDEGELGVAEQVHRYRAPTKLDELKDEPPPPPPLEPLRQEKKLTYVEIKIVDDETAQPLNWVRLIIKTPDGNENFYTTNSSGLVRIDELEPGTCDVRCDLKNARLTDTLNFVGTGEAKAGGGSNGNGTGGSNALRIAQIEIHKVKKGESIASLAAGVGMKWQDLAKFNWDTDVPNEINKHLRDDVGCTKKTKDGYNYMFDDSDNPGLMYIPTEWKQTGLATGTTHVFRVKRISGGPLLRFVLESATTGHLLPFHPFVVFDLSNNKVSSGTTNECAMGTAEVPEHGDYFVKPGDGATYKVSGRIFYQTSKTPLKNASVEVRPWDCENLNVTTTDQGEIAISDVPAGELVIAYEGKEYHVVVDQDITDGFFFVPGVTGPTPDGTESNTDAEISSVSSSSASNAAELAAINAEDF